GGHWVACQAAQGIAASPTPSRRTANGHSPADDGADKQRGDRDDDKQCRHGGSLLGPARTVGIVGYDQLSAPRALIVADVGRLRECFILRHGTTRYSAARWLTQDVAE